MGDFRVVNPTLAYEQQVELLKQEWMQSKGWVFDIESRQPKNFQPIVFASGDLKEFLILYGYFKDGQYIVQNYPYGAIEVAEKVVAYMPIAHPESGEFNEFQAVAGNLILACMTGSVSV